MVLPLVVPKELPPALQSLLAFGCVTIAERHLKKGTEHLNILRKTALGARWFISQAVYDAEATVSLLTDLLSRTQSPTHPPTH